MVLCKVREAALRHEAEIAMERAAAKAAADRAKAVEQAKEAARLVLDEVSATAQNAHTRHLRAHTRTRTTASLCRF